jgi:hypothetical protein
MASDRMLRNIGTRINLEELGLAFLPRQPQPFLDLRGASGAAYRFHKIDTGAPLPAIAGNFVYVTGEGAARCLVCCGAAESLRNALKDWDHAVRVHRANAVYVRRNVSWKIRAIEHADIVARWRPKMIAAAELDGRCNAKPTLATAERSLD